MILLLNFSDLTFSSKTYGEILMMPKGTCGTMLVLLAAVGACGWTVAAHAGDADYDVPKQVVRFADLNLDSMMGASSLYHRIESAAERVCGGSLGTRELSRAVPFDFCKAQAIGRAIDSVQSTVLTSIYLAKTGRAEKRLTVAETR
jgi:UrcA family protein